MDVVQRFYIEGKADASQAKKELGGLKSTLGEVDGAGDKLGLGLLNLDAAMNMAGRAFRAGKQALQSYFSTTEEGQKYWQALENQMGGIIGQMIEMVAGTEDQEESFRKLSDALNDVVDLVGALTGKYDALESVARRVASKNADIRRGIEEQYAATSEARIDQLHKKILAAERDAAEQFVTQNQELFVANREMAGWAIATNLVVESEENLSKAINRTLGSTSLYTDAINQVVRTSGDAEEAGYTYAQAIATYEAEIDSLGPKLEALAEEEEDHGRQVRALTADYTALDAAIKAAQSTMSIGLGGGSREDQGILDAIKRGQGEQRVRSEWAPGMYAQEDAMNLAAMITGTAEAIEGAADPAVEAMNQIQSAGLSMSEGLASAFGAALVSSDGFGASFGQSAIKAIGNLASTMGHFFILAGMGQSVPGLTWSPGGPALVGIGTALTILGGAIGGVNLGGASGSGGSRSAFSDMGLSRGKQRDSIFLESTSILMLDGETVARSVRRQESLGGLATVGG